MQRLSYGEVHLTLVNSLAMPRNSTKVVRQHPYYQSEYRSEHVMADQHKWAGGGWDERNASTVTSPVPTLASSWAVTASPDEEIPETPTGQKDPEAPGDVERAPAQLAVPEDAEPPVPARAAEPTEHGEELPVTGPQWHTAPPRAGASSFRAKKGWRGLLNHLGLRLREGKVERTDRENGYRIARKPARMVTVLVAQPHGRLGKTSISLGLGAVLVERGGHAATVVDNNEANAGTSFRSGATPGATSFDLCEASHLFLDRQKGAPELRSYMSDHQAGLFDVLAAPTTLEEIQSLTSERVSDLLRALAIGYQVTVIDSGNAVTSPNFLGALAHADVVVVPVDLSMATWHATTKLLEQIRQAGREDLITGGRIVPVVTNPLKRGRSREFLENLTANFSPVFWLTWDPHIAEESGIHWDQLKPATRHDFFEVGAHIMSIATSEGKL